MSEWRNWSWDRRCTPSRVLHPSTVAEISAVMAGAAQSGTPLASTVKAVGPPGTVSPPWPSRAALQPRLDGVSGLLSMDSEFADAFHKAFATKQTARFREMEHAAPLDPGRTRCDAQA